MTFVLLLRINPNKLKQMKRLIHTSAILLALLQLNAQTITDTVSIGPGYANHVWYSLENDEIGSAPKNDWDIAFETSSYGTSIHLNAGGGAELWVYSTDTTEWATIDTTGLSTLTKLYNSDTTWAIGAFDGIADPNDDFDLGWGTYSLATHTVTGDKIYIIKLTDGSFHKIWIKSLASGTFTFRHANVDGSGDMTYSVSKADYNTKNFVAYSLVNHAIVDREPASDDWNLVFGSYFANVPDGNGGVLPCGVTGVRSNIGVEVAVAENLADAANYTDYEAETFQTNITAIGHYWKSINMSTFQWDITDSLAYFVGTQDGDIWKLVFTGFSGSSTGNFIFSKEKLLEADTVQQVGILENEPLAATMTVYPNPNNGQEVTVVLNLLNGNETANLQVHDLAGRQVYTAQVNTNSGILQLHLPAQHLNAGLYIVTLTVNGQNTQQKLIIE
jgi:hypothetical protein